MATRLIDIDQVVFDVRDSGCQCANPFQSQGHEGGSIGIGCDAMIRYNSCTQDLLFSRITGTRVNRMGILFPLLDVEIPVIARGGNGARLIQLYDLFNVVTSPLCFIFRFVDADPPALSGRFFFYFFVVN